MHNIDEIEKLTLAEVYCYSDVHKRQLDRLCKFAENNWVSHDKFMFIMDKLMDSKDFRRRARILNTFFDTLLCSPRLPL